MNKIILLLHLFAFSFIDLTYGQANTPIALSGHSRFDFFQYHRTNAPFTWGYLFEFDPAVILLYKPIDADHSVYRYGFGIRTSFSLWGDESSQFRCERISYVGIYPLLRLYTKSNAFVEVTVGPRMKFVKYLFKVPQPSVIAPSHGKLAQWHIRIGLGYDFRLNDRISFDPILGYQLVSTEIFEIWNSGQKLSRDERGIYFLFGFKYRLLK